MGRKSRRSNGWISLYVNRQIKNLMREICVVYCSCRWHGGLINGKPAGFQFPRYTLVSYNASKIVLPGSFVQHRGLIKLHPSYFSLHWLPVTYRIEFKILVLTFKAIYQLAPFYICNLVRLKEKCKYQLRSSEELLQLPMRKT